MSETFSSSSAILEPGDPEPDSSFWRCAACIRWESCLKTDYEGPLNGGCGIASRNILRGILIYPTMNTNYQAVQRIVLSLIGISSIFQAADAAPFIYQPRDLILGFRKSGGSFELEVNVGQASRYYNATAGSTFPISEFTVAQLTDSFSDFNTLQWSVGGTVRLGDGGDTSVPVSTLWATRPRTDPATQTTPWNRQSAGALAGSSTKIVSIANNAVTYNGGVPTGPDNTATAVQVQSGDSLSYGVQMGAGGNYSGTFQGNVENTTPDSFSSGARSDLYEIRPGSGASKYLGYFQLNPEGTMSFTAAGGTVTPPPRPVASIAWNGNVNVISFTTTNGANYQLLYTNGLGLASSVATWAKKADVVIGDGSVKSIQDDPAPDTERFYVIQAK